MLDAHEPELTAGQRHDGVPPVCAFVAVAELHGACAAVEQQAAAIVESEHGIVRHEARGGKFRNDLRDLRAGADVAEETLQFGSVELRLVQIRQRRGLITGRFGTHVETGTAGWRRGSMSTALRGAGQTSWQMPQPVQTSATTIGRPRSTFIAPGTGQRSMQTEQNEVSAMQKRPWMMAVRRVAWASCPHALPSLVGRVPTLLAVL